MYILYIKALNEEIKQIYQIHSTYHEGDAGLDLFVPESITIPAWSTMFINHQIQCEMIRKMPNPSFRGTLSNIKIKIKYEKYNETFLLHPRSSISKTPLIMANSTGVIDSSYRGNIIGAVKNLSNNDYVVEKGTRLFQIVQKTYEPFSFKLVDELSQTTRGADGFGSTGK